MLNVDKIPDATGYYFAGFVDGEGSFQLTFRRRKDYTLPWKVSLCLNVSQKDQVILALFKRQMTWGDFNTALTNATRNSAMIFIIIIGAMVFSVFLTLTGSTQDLIAAIHNSGMSRWWIFFAFILMYLILGFFLDQLAILILTLPLVFPIMMSLEFNPVWLGIVFVKTAEIGLVSPPLGLNVFIVGSVTNVPVGTVFRGITPFLIADFIVLALIILFPNLALYIAEISSAV